VACARTDAALHAASDGPFGEAASAPSASTRALSGFDASSHACARRVR